MKPNEISLRHLALELMRKIYLFEEEVQWEMAIASLALFDESVSERFLDEFNRGLGFNDEEDRTEDEAIVEIDGKVNPYSLNPKHNASRKFSRLEREVARRSGSISSNYVKNIIHDKNHRNLKNNLYKMIELELQVTLESLEDPVFKKLKKVSKIFNLKEKQTLFLNLIYHETANQKTALGRLINGLSDIIEVYLDCGEGEARTLRSRSLDNPLVQKGLLNFGHRNSSFLSEMVMEFINNDGALDLSEMFLKKDNLIETFPLCSFNQSEVSKRALVNILKSDAKCNLLFSGLEGTGKTELARALAKELGIHCFFLRPFNKKGSDSLSERRAGLFAATSILSELSQSILVVDEADKLLATNRSGDLFSLFKENVNDDEKAWMNQFLDHSNLKVIFIVNKNSIDRSTLRRFNMIIEFDSLSSDQTNSMVGKILEKNRLHDIFSNELQEFIDDNPGLNIGSYALAAETASSIKDAESQKEVFYEVLNSHKCYLGNLSPKRSLSKDFDENLLNLSMPKEKLLQAIEMFIQGKSHTKQLSMMFFGLPGTGKTELAHQLARNYGMSLDIYGTSDLLDPYVGMTEKNIAKAFKKTSSGDKRILFIDEADSLFKSRASAERSWMVSQTNELLRQMENYRGIFIAATNFNSLMDEAAMRRFHIKLEFRPLTTEKLINLYNIKFQALAGDLDDQSLFNLKNFKNLAPGDVHAVWSRLAFQERLTHQEIIGELKKELVFKQGLRKINL